MNHKIQAALIAILLSLFGCNTIPKKLSSYSDRVAIYRIDVSKENPLKEFGVSPQPWTPQRDQLRKMLKLVYYGRLPVFGGVPKRLFTDLQAENTTQLLIEAGKRTKEGDLYFVLVGEEDRVYPQKAITRSSFYLFQSNGRLQVLFAEARTHVIFQEPFSFSDWAAIPLPDPEPESDNELVIPEPFLGDAYFPMGKNNKLQRNWIVFGTPPRKKSETGDPGTLKVEKETEGRLKELKDLLEKGLITEEEYKAKRKAILNDI